MLILIIGEFGVGKDTIADMLVEYMGSIATKIKSWTTRDPRYPEEDTHEFFWWPESTIKDRNKVFEKEILNSGRLVAYTTIDNCYYWTEADQFGKKPYEFYVVDKKGATDVIHDNILDQKVIVIEVIRDRGLIKVDESRLNRMPHHIQPDIPVTIRFHNLFKNLEELKEQIPYLVNGILSYEIE